MFVSLAGLHAQYDPIAKVEEMLQQNELSEAKSLLLNIPASTPKDDKYYLYLGYIYETEKNYSKAVEVLADGIQKTSANRDIFYFNTANCYSQTGSYDLAESYYTKTIEANFGFSGAYLNRANTRIRLGKWETALADYSLFLKFEPEDTQRETIEKAMEILKNRIAADNEKMRIEEDKKKLEEEARRIEQEQNIKEAAEKLRIAEEQKKIEDEKRRLEEEAKKLEDARQKALLDSILESLENVGRETENIAARNDTIVGENPDGDLLE